MPTLLSPAWANVIVVGILFGFGWSIGAWVWHKIVTALGIQ